MVAVAVTLKRPLAALTGEVTLSVTPVRMFEGNEILFEAKLADQPGGTAADIRKVEDGHPVSTFFKVTQ